MLTPRQSFNVACLLQQDRIMAFLRPQTISSLPHALLYKPAPSSAREGGTVRAVIRSNHVHRCELTETQRRKQDENKAYRERKKQVQRSNRNTPLTPTLFERYVES